MGQVRAVKEIRKRKVMDYLRELEAIATFSSRQGKPTYTTAKAYRVISLLSCWEKVVEKAIATCIASFCNIKDVFHRDTSAVIRAKVLRHCCTAGCESRESVDRETHRVRTTARRLRRGV
jgi:CHAD domain-containing protein